jgi:hypothetical protein
VDASGSADDPASSRDGTQHLRAAGVLTWDQPVLEPITSTDVRAASLSITADLVEGASRQIAAKPPTSTARADPIHAVIASVNAANNVLVAPLPHFRASSTGLATSRKTNRH